jgi:hypothetical protein
MGVLQGDAPRALGSMCVCLARGVAARGSWLRLFATIVLVGCFISRGC